MYLLFAIICMKIAEGQLVGNEPYRSNMTVAIVSNVRNVYIRFIGLSFVRKGQHHDLSLYIMQTRLLNLSSDITLPSLYGQKLSFRPFIRFLKDRQVNSGGLKNEYLSQVIETFERSPELLDEMDVTDIKNYPE